jgi:geranylgeranyl diphosphate synthase type II
MDKYLSRKQVLINQALNKYLPPTATSPRIIHQATRYSVLNGGKRLRGILALMTGELFGAPNSRIMPFACALEMVHAYSLIHDDLPAMDNDDFRRGKPTCHKAFGEAIAILTGDALLTYAFQLIPDKIQDKKIIPALISELARAAGSTGMVGGQAMDIQNENTKANKINHTKILKEIHLRKTAAMIAVSARGAGIICNAPNKELAKITAYGRNLGLAFQIIDDILDVNGSKKQLGKTPGKDAKLRKLTYPAIKGLKASVEEAEDLIKLAKNSLTSFGEKADRLRKLADYLLTRKA